MASLLPPNASPAETALAEGVGRLSELPVSVGLLWNPDTCPASLLPWLAWAMSVDQWEADWSESQKREVIRQSVAVHRIKGTRGAVQGAINALGYTVTIKEWWEQDPKSAPFTFSLEIEVDDRGISKGLYDQLRTTVEVSKNVRSHLSTLTAVSRVSGTYRVGCGAVSGQVVEVAPWQPEDIGAGQAEAGVGAAFIYYQSTTIQPLGG